MTGQRAVERIQLVTITCVCNQSQYIYTSQAWKWNSNILPYYFPITCWRTFNNGLYRASNAIHCRI